MWSSVHKNAHACLLKVGSTVRFIAGPHEGEFIAVTVVSGDKILPVSLLLAIN